MNCCVLTFSARSGTGDQTVTGVVDRDGNAFVPTGFLFQSAYAAANTVTYGGIPTNAYCDFRGIDLLTKRSAVAVGDVEAAGFKDVAGGYSDGNVSLLDFNAQPSFGGAVLRQAYVSAVASGSFTLTYTQNDRTGDIIRVTVFGGDDLSLEAIGSLANGAHATTAKPQGVLTVPSRNLSASGGVTTATGGQCVTWGWDTRDGNRGAAAIQVDLQGSQYVYQRTDAFGLVIGNPTVLSTVSAWNDLAYTVSGNTASALSEGTPLAFCGTNIVAAAGSFTQQAGTGAQVITVDIDAQWIMFLSVGNAASTSVATPVAQFVQGWAAGATQNGYWGGESVPGGFTTPLKGARYLDTAHVLRFGNPDALSTTFTAVAAVTLMDPVGEVTIDWSINDGVGREIIWFAIGEAIVPPPPPPEPVFHTNEVVRRRLRRAPIVWSEKDGLQTRVRINLFAVDMQPGVGTRDIPDPQVMIRASKDGGFTWGNERLVSAGRVGEYFDRLNSWQWGQGRDWVFEVACTDPVTWNLVGAYLDAEGGTS